MIICCSRSAAFDALGYREGLELAVTVVCIRCTEEMNLWSAREGLDAS